MNSEWDDGGKPGGNTNNFVHQIVQASSLPSQLLSRIYICELH